MVEDVCTPHRTEALKRIHVFGLLQGIKYAAAKSRKSSCGAGHEGPGNFKRGRRV